MSSCYGMFLALSLPFPRILLMHVHVRDAASAPSPQASLQCAQVSLFAVTQRTAAQACSQQLLLAC